MLSAALNKILKRFLKCFFVNVSIDKYIYDIELRVMQVNILFNYSDTMNF